MNLSLYTIKWKPSSRNYSEREYEYKSIGQDVWAVLDSLYEKEGFHNIDHSATKVQHSQPISVQDALEWFDVRFYDLTQLEMDLQYELRHLEKNA